MINFNYMKRILYLYIITLLLLSLASCVSSQNIENIQDDVIDPINVSIVASNIGSDNRTVYKIIQNESRGYNIDAYLTVPEEVLHPYIIVSPYKTNRITSYDQKNEAIFAKATSSNYSWQGNIFKETKAIGLYLVIPEIRDDIRHLALDPEILIIRDKFSHIERQAARILMDAIIFSKENLHLEIKDKVDMIGYSGEANFVTRFSLFYPELMHSACAGGGSWAPALPVSRLYGEILNYPLGIADFKRYSGKPFNLEEWRKINFYIDMGNLDGRGSYYYGRIKELNKFKNIKLTNKHFKEIWEDFCDFYIKSTTRAQMVTYQLEGHQPLYKDYVAFLIANIGEEFVPLNKFSSKASYKTASGISM